MSKPLEASVLWDTIEAIEWEVMPLTPFWNAVRFLKMPYRLGEGGLMMVRTTLQDLFLVVACCQNRQQTYAAFVPSINGFVSLAPEMQ